HRRGILPPGGWRFFTARSAVVRHEIINKKAALGLLIERDPYTDRDLTIEQIARSPMCLFAAANHPLARQGTPVSLHAIRDEVIVLDKEQSTYRAIFEAMLRRAGVAIQRRDAFSNIEAVKSAVQAGPGVALLPYFALAHDVEEGRLGIIPLTEEPISIQI